MSEPPAATDPLQRVALPLEGAPFPGYFGRQRCTLIAPLPFRALGLDGPLFQCATTRFLVVDADAAVHDNVTVALGGTPLEPRGLHVAARGSFRVPTAWLRTTLVRGADAGLERWTPPATTTWEPYGSGLPSERPTAIGATEHEVWVLSAAGIFSASLDQPAMNQGPSFERVVPLSAFATTAEPDIRPESVHVVPARVGEALVRVDSDTEDLLFVVASRHAQHPVRAEVVRRLSIPEGPGAERPGAHGGAGGGGGGGQGMAAPRRNLIRRVGAEVWVATKDDRVLRLEGDTLVPLTFSPPLHWLYTQTFEQEGVAAAGPNGDAVLVLGGRLYHCHDDRCTGLPAPVAADGTAESFAHVVHIEGSRFLVLSGGAAVWDTSP